jgi:hypothetical protein
MTQREIYTRIFEKVLPVLLDKLTSKEDYPSPAAKVSHGDDTPVGQAIIHAEGVAWRASFKWVDNMKTFAAMDDDIHLPVPNNSSSDLSETTLEEFEEGDDKDKWKDFGRN